MMLASNWHRTTHDFVPVAILVPRFNDDYVCRKRLWSPTCVEGPGHVNRGHGVHAADESDAVMIDHMRLWVGRRLTLRLVQKSGASYLRECIGLKCRWRLVLAALFVFDT